MLVYWILHLEVSELVCSDLEDKRQHAPPKRRNNLLVLRGEKHQSTIIWGGKTVIKIWKLNFTETSNYI